MMKSLPTSTRKRTSSVEMKCNVWDQVKHTGLYRQWNQAARVTAALLGTHNHTATSLTWKMGRAWEPLSRGLWYSMWCLRVNESKCPAST